VSAEGALFRPRFSTSGARGRCWPGAPEEEKGGCGTGFVATLPEADAEAVVDTSEDARVIGRVEEGEEAVSVRGLELRD